jgi:hypothetical protein
MKPSFLGDGWTPSSPLRRELSSERSALVAFRLVRLYGLSWDIDSGTLVKAFCPTR